MSFEPLDLTQIAAIAGGKLFGAGAKPVTITEVGLDSTQLPEGALFAALPGTRSHGARYANNTKAAAVLTDAEGKAILDASSGGAAVPVIVVDQVRKVLGKVAAAVYGNPSAKLKVIGITGTSGKTTTSYLLEKGLLAAGKQVGLIGTTGTRINGRPVPTKLTTPEAPTLQALFATMLAEGVTHVVMEVSSHALSLGRVDGTEFSVGGFSNLSQDHLDFHSTMEDYFQAKACLFAPDSPLRAQAQVIMVDDQWGQKMAHLAGPSAITVGTNPPQNQNQDEKPDFFTHDVRVEPSGSQHFQLTNGLTTKQVSLQLPGAFNVANAALAIALAAQLDSVDLDRFLEGISHAQVPGRMERIDVGQDFLAVVDYAHKPAAVAAVLDSVRAQTEGRIAVVVGAGGDRDSTKRPIMGAEAARRAQLVVVTDDNPRSEDPAVIRSQVLEGARGQEQAAADEAAEIVEIAEIADRAEAIRFAVQWASAGDAVVIAGKGHEVGQQVGDTVHHFDDREQLTQALQERALQERGGEGQA
ncbi:UDP-N-acetylmuramoyl-L-alanyl-D-glutamate--2,6-diaminopimelate ligase [Corynebacterium kozikiae]|uniref:UDP-N-acetylmuramoyl-L-alanyl-D-glutamate--2, 6-diaminopimelate ligase n=1 Tax=Corynebacterium kozikiae TaxID=2968469 RepID=UPI00211C5D91|nr:UDP-N-acetylmuramoyl-L-alanyl-D-glutamate--2,6-diaminopimelate ligase [Corynebacterium sp. 76QC2CO]MCQ9342281.1 UDP-N-acetylmuramoyl-L-alanyl-D-glutamate--2,6-diaminopimelate ligase [Corynebacterium sp. 76QC2CO]